MQWMHKNPFVLMLLLFKHELAWNHKGKKRFSFSISDQGTWFTNPGFSSRKSGEYSVPEQCDVTFGVAAFFTVSSRSYNPQAQLQVLSDLLNELSSFHK